MTADVLRQWTPGAACSILHRDGHAAIDDHLGRRRGRKRGTYRTDGLTPEEVDDVFLDPASTFDRSRRSGLPIAFGTTRTGRYIMVAFDEIDPDTVYPVTAYDVPKPKT